MKLIIILVAFLSIYHQAAVDCKPKSSTGKKWVLLVAGSNGWYNYRHQADICHSYQIVHKHGIPDENIVVMMYDDLAQNSRNPTPGKIINKPNGPDVYKGVLKDYTGSDVTPENFLNILQGKKSAMTGIGSGKVIESGPDDDVFVYFADHGAPGLIAFPDGAVLHVNQLNNAISSMREKKKYKQMVFYVEACESGSMFQNHLPSDVKVFATTAANAEESSYACYWDSERRTYLGDVYSVKWMENSDKADLETETLQQQFERVKKETKTSHVQEYGDMSQKNEPLATYQGNKAAKTNLKDLEPVSVKDAVPAPEVPLMILYRSLETATTKKESQKIMMQIEQEKKMRSTIRTTVKQILRKIVQHEGKLSRMLMMPAKLKELKCYEAAVEKFSHSCFKFNKYEHALRYVYTLSNLCDSGVPTKTILSTIEHVCQPKSESQYIRF